MFCFICRGFPLRTISTISFETSICRPGQVVYVETITSTYRNLKLCLIITATTSVVKAHPCGYFSLCDPRQSPIKPAGLVCSTMTVRDTAVGHQLSGCPVKPVPSTFPAVVERITSIQKTSIVTRPCEVVQDFVICALTFSQHINIVCIVSPHESSSYGLAVQRYSVLIILTRQTPAFPEILDTKKCRSVFFRLASAFVDHRCFQVIPVHCVVFRISVTCKKCHCSTIRFVFKTSNAHIIHSSCT